MVEMLPDHTPGSLARVHPIRATGSLARMLTNPARWPHDFLSALPARWPECFPTTVPARWPDHRPGSLARPPSRLAGPSTSPPRYRFDAPHVYRLAGPTVGSPHYRLDGPNASPPHYRLASPTASHTTGSMARMLFFALPARGHQRLRPAHRAISCIGNSHALSSPRSKVVAESEE